MNNQSKIFSTIFFLISLLFISIILKAHNYIPIPEDSTVRWVMYYQFYDQGSCEEKYLFNYRIAGDTSLNGINYKKVNVENILLIENTAGIPGCARPFTHEGFIFGFRQDTLLKKCYKPRDTISEFIFYDFSLQVNDTFHTFFFDSLFNNGCPDSIPTLHSLDSVLINNQYHLRQNFNCGDYVIEGIGWLTDPFMTHTMTNYLVCMKKDTELIYQNPGLAFYCNWIPLNIKPPNNKSSSIFNFSIVNHEIQIICDQIISNIEIFDLMGRKIYAADNKTTSINLDTFSFPDFIIMKVYLKDNTIIIKKLFLKQ